MHAMYRQEAHDADRLARHEAWETVSMWISERVPDAIVDGHASAKMAYRTLARLRRKIAG